MLIKHCVVLFSLGMTACVTQSKIDPPAIAASVQGNRSATTNTSDLSARRSVGQYHAKRIDGDFAGYTNLQQFVDRMVQKHGFEREYLMGVFFASPPKKLDARLSRQVGSDLKRQA
jgi:membrane-bound lytic murein transglycosylase B